jgi:hypothetical protein
VHNKNSIHVANITLMIVSLVVAVIIPFELFLLAYAVLGPLHYLTEINWLQKNGFYIKNQKQIWIPVLLTLLVSISFVFTRTLHLPLESSLVPFFGFINRAYATIILIILITSIGLLYQELYSIVTLVIISVLIIYLFRNTTMYQLFAGTLLPSLVHVYIFTLMFMAYGVTKTKSSAGLLEILFLLIVPMIIAFLPVNSGNYALATKTLVTFRNSNFGALNISLGKLLGSATNQDREAFIFSATGIKIQIFIAFAYLYHYLNWFSKISLIGWLKNTSSQKLFVLILLWVISVSLYFYDYRIGLGVLFFLSLLHVTLEFPLNILSMQVVFRFITSRFRSNP